MYKFFQNSPYVFSYLGELRPAQIWRHLRGYALARLGRNILQSIFICPAHDCNADCPHCFEKFAHEKFQQSLSTEQVKDIIDQFHNLGGYLIFFCSGEFLLRQDAIALVEYAAAKNLAIAITSNGILLDEKKITELKKAGVNCLFISIDSANEARHDALRGVPGCFRKATNAIRLAKKARISAGIWTYATRSNPGELPEISILAKELNADGVFTFLPLLSGHLMYKPEENFSAQERKALRKKIRFTPNTTLEFMKEDDLCTGGGRFHICVMPSGDVTFCPPVPYSYGNIKEQPLKDCLKKIKKDYSRFCLKNCKGQCPINFQEYRDNCNAEFMYK